MVCGAILRVNRWDHLSFSQMQNSGKNHAAQTAAAPWIRALRPVALWRMVSAMALVAFAVCVAGPAVAAPAAPLILGVDADPDTFTNRWTGLFFAEAFRRLDIPIQLNYYPLARRTLLVDSGEIDVDAGRVRAYGDAHPHLVRVEESWVAFNFSLFTANPALQLQNLEDLRTKDVLVEYRRGILFCERTLKAVVPSDRLSDISSEEQAVNKLLVGRTDLYCDLEYVVDEVLNLPQIKGAKRVRKVMGIGSVPIFTYLQPRHAHLAPRLAAVFKTMKAEGLVEAYQAQVAHEMGRLP